MKHIGGATLGLIGGLAYLGFVFVMGWQTGSVLIWVIWAAVACLLTVAAMHVLVSWFPSARVWPYLLSFAAPLLAVGLLALTGEVPAPAFLAIGLTTLGVGLAVTHRLMRRAPQVSGCRHHGR